LEKRFAIRDLVLYAFMGVILVSIWLAMFQIDRQWLFIAQTQSKLDGQTRDLADLKRQLRQGRLQATTALPSADGTIPDTWRGFSRAQDAANKKDFAEGDWLVYTFGSALPTLTPFLSGDAYASRVQRWVLDTLATRDPVTLEWLPLVASSWETADDGLSYSFEVRPDVSFADGEPLTADDVVFTFDFIMDERIAAPRDRGYMARIDRVEAQGSTVTFHMKEPYFQSFELAAEMPILAEHVYGKYLNSVADAEVFNSSTNLLFGSGPYRMDAPARWSPGDSVELVRNDRYWGWVPSPFERRVWKTIESDAAQLTEFKNGGIDVYGALPLAFRDLVADERITDRTQNYEYYGPRDGYFFIAWNQLKEDKPTLFSDPRVREAMTYLTDRQRIADEIYLGYAQPANGPFNPRGKQANPDLPLREFDLDKARALLLEAGFADRDGDGILESQTGEPLKFKITYPAASDNYKSLMLLLKDLYVRAGVVMELAPEDWPILIEQLNTKNFDAISLGWTGSFEIDVYQNMHSSQTEPGGDNFINHIDTELDALIEAARSELDEDKRMAFWHQVHTSLWESQPYTYLMRTKKLVFVDRRIKNVQVVRAGINQGGLWRMPMEWYVPGGDQTYIN
jgi:peptide/nickel transport system substrate-binding protein